jgi:serine/threonine protein kinase
LTRDVGDLTVRAVVLREIRELGRGTFGRVYLAEDTDLGRTFAVKELINPDADVVRFEREIRVLLDQLDNRYVVDIYRWDLRADRPYLVMEYCEFGSLRGRVGNTGWEETAAILSQAAEGVLGIHIAGGFHRDLKPDNLLVARGEDGNPIVKVADFGLARRPMTAQPPMTQTPGGTPGYMAPELALAGARFTPQADIFSLGVVGIELLTGRLDVASLNALQIPTDLANLLRRMVSPFPAIRPAAADLILALDRILNPPQPPPAPLPRPVQQPAPSNGGLGWLLVGLAGAAAAVVALGAGDKAAWDENVGRYRSSDGKFRRR